MYYLQMRMDRHGVFYLLIKRTSTEKKKTRSTTRKLAVAPFDYIYIRSLSRSIDRSKRNNGKVVENGDLEKVVCFLLFISRKSTTSHKKWKTTHMPKLHMPRRRVRYFSVSKCEKCVGSQNINFFLRQLLLLHCIFVIECPKNRFVMCIQIGKCVSTIQ